jgi:DNA-3-methyladenine glycosylase I
MKPKIRCPWADKGDPLYARYHDEEWGVPVYDDRKLFEFLVLESAQAGLSWITVLRKRENYRKAFADFDYHKVAKFNAKKVAQLLNNAGIIRNRLKILATINNAQRFLEVQKEFGTFSEYMWGFVDHQPLVHKRKSLKEVPATTDISDALAKDLKARGFKFLGSTVIYAHMQAVGMVNDHLLNCHSYITKKRKARRPASKP